MPRDQSDLQVWKAVDKLLDSVVLSSRSNVGPGQQLIMELNGDDREAIKHAKAKHFNDPHRLLAWKTGGEE